MEKVDPSLQTYERVPDYNIKHRPDFLPRRYLSIQEKVNSSKEYEIYYINKLIKEGWYKLESNELILDEKLKGRHFKYRLNGNSLSSAKEGTFRSGGMIIGKNKDQSNEYILYKAYNGCIFPLQISDIQEIYIKDPNVKIEGNKKEKVIKNTVYFKEPTLETKFPVYLVSPATGNNIVVYYAKDNYHKDRFMMTKKYEYAFRTRDWGFE